MNQEDRNPLDYYTVEKLRHVLGMNKKPENKEEIKPEHKEEVKT